MKGGMFFVVMDSVPNIHFSTADNEIPVSEINDHLININPYSSKLERIFFDSLKVDLIDIYKNDIYYTTDGKTPDKTCSIYTEPLLINKSTNLKYIS